MTKLRTNKSTIKNDPFASVIPIQAKEEVAERTVRLTPAKPLTADLQPANTSDLVGSEAKTPSSNTPVQIGRAKLTVHLEADLVNRVKNAAYWNPRLTIARIAERGIRLALKEVEKENGGPYAQREADLIGGRPIK